MIARREAAQAAPAAALVPLDAGPARPAARRPEPAELGLDLVQALRLVRRRWRLAALVAVTLTMLATCVIALLPPTYRAEALLVLDPRRSKVSELQAPTEALLSRTQSDLSAIRTETELVTSPTVLREVAARLKLADAAPEPALKGIELGGAVAWLQGWLRTAAGSEAPAPVPEAADAGRRLDRAVEVLAGGQVTVVNEGGAYTLRVRADAGDPVLAARIANAVAEVHLEQQAAQQEAGREAESAWLRDRLEGLRATVRESDAAVESYRTRHRLAQGSAASTLEGRISEVNSAVTTARTRLSRGSANLAEATSSLRRDDGQSAPAVLASPLIQGLSVQEAALLGRRSELQQAVGARHPSILDVDAQLAGLRSRIDLETRRIVAGLRAEVVATRNEIADLERQLGELEDQRESDAGATVELAELERRAAANREIYAQVLAQFSASLVRQAGSLSEMRLAAAARPPLDPAGPNRKLLVAGAAAAASALGVLAALGVGFRRAGFGGAALLEQATGLPTLELVPELGRRQRQRFRQGHVPAVRGLAFMLDAAACQATAARPALILVTSAVRAEGKSFCAGQLARLLATLGTRRVLLVDLDFWRPAVGRLAAELRAESTGAVLDGGPLLRDPATGLDLLTVDHAAAADGRAQGFARRLAAVRAGRSGHDLVVLDAPPVLPIPDVLAAAGAADATLLVVRFERTPAAAVRSALLRLGSVGVRPLGTVLSRVVMPNYRRYGYPETEIPVGET